MKSYIESSAVYYYAIVTVALVELTVQVNNLVVSPFDRLRYEEGARV